MKQVGVSPEIHRDAEILSMTSRDVPFRATDALHIALARDARATAIVTLHRLMAAASRAVGLATMLAIH